MIFYRGSWTEFWLRISSNEPLGLLDTSYKEDYYGNDGYLTLHHLSTGDRIPILMVEAPEITPSIPRDNFIGSMNLDIMQDGLYRVEGRVRDELGNYTILSDFVSPAGDEEILPLQFELRSGYGDAPQISIGVLVIAGGITLQTTLEETLATLQIAVVADTTALTLGLREGPDELVLDTRMNLDSAFLYLDLKGDPEMHP